jgi:predicted lipoprotein with Yx(FWY)xxD motif
MKRVIATALLLTLTPLLLAACSDDEPEESGSDATATASTTTEATATTADATATATTAATETAAATEATTASPAAAGATVSVATEGDLAPYLVGPEGMTLYLFTNDEDGVSNCTGGCLGNWPPLLLAEGEEPTAGDGVTGELGVIEREDGEGRQVTYNGIPLYYWQGDTAPGDTTGHEVGGVWFVVPPTESTAAAPIAGTSNVPGY